MSEVQYYRQCHSILEDFIVGELKSDPALLITNLNLKQWRLQIIRIRVQELILPYNTVE